MFNAPDRLHDPAEGLPLGYFITRILAGDEKYLSPAALSGYVDDLLEAASTTETIAQSVIEALMERTNLKPTDEVKMSGRRRSIPLAEVQERYTPLFERWVQKFGYTYTLNAIRGEMNSLGWFADRLCRNEGYKVVVLGHTHEAMNDDDGIFTTSRVYANSGYFCCPQPTFVEVDKQAKAFEVKIWKGKRATDFEITKSAKLKTSE